MIKNKFIPTEIAEQIKSTAVLTQVIEDFVELKKQGTSQVGHCPNCGAKKFTVTPAKEIYKCFSGCEKGGNNAVQFLTDVVGKTYPEALAYLADRYNISTEEPVGKKKKRSNRKGSFRDAQLKASGISNRYQKYALRINEQTTETDHDRYQAATIDQYGNVIPGDDMILHYLDLDGKPITYKNTKGSSRILTRVRWSNPDLHPDKSGKPVKYRSPYGSGSHLWLPNYILKAYKTNEIIETLYICEGEKKADKMCIEGMPAVGIMGIHNFETDKMPYEFELLIKTCAVARVVFVLDADWQDLSLKPHKPVDQRPKTFFRAVLNFRNYFYAYVNNGIELDIFFAYHKDKAYKGIDDLLVLGMKKKRTELKPDFEKAFIDREGEGEWIKVEKITSMSEYQLKEFWNLHSHPAFIKANKEELQVLREFTLGKLKRRWNEETGDFELAQKLLPHEQFWKKIVWETRSGKEVTKYEFRYRNIRSFLRNRGFGLYHAPNGDLRFVHQEGKVLREVQHHQIQKFVIDFTEEINENDVVELLLRGGKQYLGPDKLGNMFHLTPTFLESERDAQYLIFKNVYWKITAEEIIERPIGELPKYVWQNKLIDFEAKYFGQPMATVERNGENWEMETTKAFEQCEMAQFFLRSSWFHFRKAQKLVADKTGRKSWRQREECEPETLEDVKLTMSNLVAKMLATGYVLHDYRDYANMKAIVAMDGLESEVGKSQGGTGKSVWLKMFKHLVPVEIIDGKRKNIEDDNHLYENVDERTHAIGYDDVRVNYNIENLFSQITTGVRANPKGQKSFTLLPPKFIVITNHALKGEGNSFDRRQYLISFSDYYNKFRTIGDDFGHQLFHEWEYDEWNRFYNWMATCIQVFLRYRLQYSIPTQSLKRRKLRQDIGENFLDFASLMYDAPDGLLLNAKVEKGFALEKYLERYKADSRYVNVRVFKEKIKKYAAYAGYEFNPTTNGSRLKSDGREYFILAGPDFNSSLIRTINNDQELNARRIENDSGPI